MLLIVFTISGFSQEEESFLFPNENIYIKNKKAGTPVDSSIKKPIQILLENEELLVIKNYFHLDEFWIAVIPHQEMTSASYQNFQFSRHVGHNQVKINFKKEILLYPISASLITYIQNNNTVPKDQTLIKSSDLVISFDAVQSATETFKFNPLRGAFGAYAGVYRVMSEITKLRSYSKDKQDSRSDYLLDFNKAELKSLLFKGLRLSESNWIGYYHPLLRSCTSESQNLIIDSLREERQEAAQILKYTFVFPNTHQEFMTALGVEKKAQE